MATTSPQVTSPQVMQAALLHGVNVAFSETGHGQPLLFLHPGHGNWGDRAFLDALAPDYRVIAPVAPWFGADAGPPNFSSVQDLAYLYLDLVDHLELDNVILAGSSFGGWIAAEMAVKSCQRLAALALLAPVGIKTGGRSVRDVIDTFGVPDKEWQERAFADPSFRFELKALDDTELFSRVRAKEALARYAWSPYMHNPKLKGRLHRVTCPTLVVGGCKDRILRTGYPRDFAEAIPGARYEDIARAGHFPHIEQSAQIAGLVHSFVKEARQAVAGAVQSTPVRERV
jgi:pimeloyl-ACP methyl ester carboxylesterase